MQIISARPLIEKFRNDTFEETEVGPYFIAYMVSQAVFWIFAFGEANAWYIAGAIAKVVVTFLGVLHLRNQNRGSFANQFAAKFFCFSWVVTVRMLLLGVPAIVVITAFVTIIGGDDVVDPALALLTIGFEAVYFWWIGSLIAQSSSLIGEPSHLTNP